MEKNKISKVFKKLLIWLMLLSLIVPMQMTANAATKLSAPTVSVKNVSSGVNVSWNKVSGATGYYVYRKTGDSYKKIKTVTGTSYTDKSVSSGTTYTYKVKSYKGDTKATSSAKKILHLSTPSVTVSNTKSGIKVSWDKVKGAKKYRIYQKDSGKWKKLADVTGTSYTDKSVKSGKSRTYTVKALNGDYASSYVSGKKMLRLSAPSFKVANTTSGVKLSWDKVKGAKKYRIYQKDSGKWKKLADVTDTSYIDKRMKSGQKRTYTVKALNGDYASSYNSGKTQMFLDTPVVKFEDRVKGVRVYWEPVEPSYTTSTYYKVYRKENGKWVKLGATEDIQYIVTDAVYGKEETYTVKTIHVDYSSGARVEYVSSYKSFKHTYLYDEETHKHKWKTVVTYDPTCEDDAYEIQVCYACEKERTVITGGKATGHNWKDEVKLCYMCDGCREKWYFDEEDDLGALDFVEIHIDYSECPEGGTTYSKVYESVGKRCTNCGKIEEHNPKEHAHLWVEAGRENPTCEEDGYSAYECIDCGEKKTEIEEATGHDWEDDVTPCYMCNGCEEKWYFDKEDDSEALDSAEKHIDSSECPEGGTAYISAYESVGRHCTICGKTEKYDSEEHKHIWVEANRVNPTCEENGSVWYRCYNCKEDKWTVGEAATGHDLEFTSRIEPVCGDDGALIYTCKTCGETEKEVIETTGKHEWEDIVELHWVEDESYEDGGYYIKIVTGIRCTICGKESEN